jgi:hypothetical protein
MGAGQTWVVTVFKLVPDTVEVSAITKDEAMQEAKSVYGVAHALDAWPKSYEEYKR